MPKFASLVRFSPFLLIIALIAGCGTSNSTDDPSLEDLVGVTWELRYISENGFGVEAPPVDTMFSITFNEDGSFSARDNCNLCNGSYELNGEKIQFSEIGCSLASCVTTRSNIQLAPELQKVSMIQIDNEKLFLGYQESGTTRVLHLDDASRVQAKEVIIADTEHVDRSAWEDGNYLVDFVDLKDDILTLRISYSGCDISDVNMVFGNYFMESSPVQAYAFLPKVNELCQAHFVKDYSFDLTNLKETYLEGYQDTGGTIDISIRENDETLERFLYNF